jgi:hypothetical protein
LTRATTFRSTAVIGGVLLAILMIMTVSRAAFTAETDNAANSWAAGQLQLDNDSPGTALFNIDNIAPGDAGSNCIEIIHSGVDANIVLSGIATGGTGLQDLLNVTVTRFAGGACDSGSSFTVYNGTLSAFGGDTSDPSWDTSVLGSTQHYKIAWTLPIGTDNAAQGATGLARFTWTATSN